MEIQTFKLDWLVNNLFHNNAALTAQMRPKVVCHELESIDYYRRTAWLSYLTVRFLNPTLPTQSVITHNDISSSCGSSSSSSINDDNNKLSLPQESSGWHWVRVVFWKHFLPLLLDWKVQWEKNLNLACFLMLSQAPCWIRTVLYTEVVTFGWLVRHVNQGILDEKSVSDCINCFCMLFI